MSLTPAQRTTVLTQINQTPEALALKQAGDSFGLAAWLNANSAVDAWRTDVPVTSIIDSIAWDKYTPNDPADDTVTYLNRSLLAQIKQMNLQIMLQGRETLDCSKASIRSGLRDAVIAAPTGASGAPTSPGGASGATTLGVCVRPARRVEEFLAGNPAQTGAVTAVVLTFEGQVDSADAAYFVNN